MVFFYKSLIEIYMYVFSEQSQYSIYWIILYVVLPVSSAAESLTETLDEELVMGFDLEYQLKTTQILTKFSHIFLSPTKEHVRPHMRNWLEGCPQLSTYFFGAKERCGVPQERIKQGRMRQYQICPSKRDHKLYKIQYKSAKQLETGTISPSLKVC